MPHCNKQMLSFFITTKCNLCCKYCYNAAERNAIEEKTLSIEIAKAAIDWFFENNESRHIRFYGPGEPSQELELIKQITEYAKSHPNKGSLVTTEIQTNGVFNEEFLHWAVDNINIMWISFDGTPDVQDYYRPINPKYAINGCLKSSTVIEDNIKWFLDNMKDNSLIIGARTTITEKNISRQIEMVDYFSKIGIKYIWTDPVFQSVDKIPACYDNKKINSFHFNYDLYVDNYIPAYYYAKEKGIFWGSFLAVNFDGKSPYHCRCCTPLEAPHITPDGFISSCDMVVLGNKSYHMNPFIVGKWDDSSHSFNFDADKIKALYSRRSTELDYCTNCPAILNCGGYCAGETVNMYGKLSGQIPDICAAIVKLYNELGENYKYEYLHP